MNLVRCRYSLMRCLRLGGGGERTKHILTLRGYIESGRVHGAIARTADTTYTSLMTDQQNIAKSIFLQLTELGEGTQDTCRRVSLNAFARRPEDKDRVEVVLNMLADRRLLTIDNGVVQVAHEALIREWNQLRNWLDEDRMGLKKQRRIENRCARVASLGLRCGLVVSRS